ncbi:MAG: hypothetical protein M1833_006159 [Piccolia ochrophora]|nr:MAG: hypothetical protein M1833_006159 [Piccolia ochrophora]
MIRTNHHVLTSYAEFDLYCKMTDFGVSRLPTGGVILGGSRPWQAPECSRGAYFMIEAAKQTDVYSFGMLLWRVMLDGDPFQTLGEFEGKTPKDKRQQRNEAVAALKDEDSLVKHVCSSLALSENFSRSQLEMLCEVINMTLTKEPRHRELDMARLIRMLTPNNWYQRRHPVDPQRIEMDFDVQLLDIEKYYSEFKKASPVVQSRIALGYREYAEGSKAQGQDVDDENRSAAAYQLAICYAVGFGVEFQPEECLKWLRFAAGKGSQKAQESLPKIVKAFESQQDDFVNVTVNDGIDQSVFSLSSATSSYPEEEFLKPGDASGLFRPLHFGGDDGDITSGWTLLRAAEACRYDVLDALLSKSAKPGASEDGVSPIHFLSSWDVNRAEQLGQSLVRAGADVNARAKWGGSVGGTPLMWSVYGDHLMHSTILMKLGADPMAATEDGIDALSFAAQLHLTEHLRLLLENSRPAKVRGHMNRLIEAAASGESRYVRITRHTDHWKTAAIGTLQLLQSWNALFPDAVDFKKLLLPALHSSLNSAFGRMNTDVQLTFIDHNNIEPSQLTKMLRDSVVDYNRGLFEALLDRGVPVTGTFDQGKNLLHLCAKIPDHITAAAVFAPRLLALGAVLEAHDDTGLTPWMDAVLERKWDLADLYLEKGAEPLATDNDGYNVLGLTIIAINAGSIKYLLKYCAARVAFHQKSFLINPTKNISALQQAALLSLPPEHGMKIEVMGVFLLMLANFGSREQVDFRSDAFLPNATALEVAASRGNAHPVKNLTKNGAHRAAGKRAVEFARERLASTTDYLERKNLERCVFIIENWDDESKNTRKLADDWTNMRTIDDSHVRSSWELISWDYKGMKKI